MPDVIDLISSTPPSAPARAHVPTASSAADLISSPRQPLHTRSSTARPARTSTVPTASRLFTFSDDIDIDIGRSQFSSFGDEIDFGDKPAKKRRLSDEGSPLSPDPKAFTGLSNHGQDQFSGKPANSLFRFSDDLDDEAGLPPARPIREVLSGDNKTTAANGEDSDPIVFTSSAPELSRMGKAPAERSGPGLSVFQQRTEFQRTNTITIGSDSDDFGSRGMNGESGRRDDIEFSDMPDIDDLIAATEQSTSTTDPLFTSKTASLLASLENGPASRKKSTTDSRSRKKSENQSDNDDDDDDLAEPPQPKRKTNPKPTSEDKEAKARQREATKAQREREKQAEKDRKAKLKEEKAKEKQLASDLAQANKSKVDKKESTPEMIIDMDSSLEGTSVGNQAVEYMKRLGVEYTFFTSSIRGIVKWRRKVKATFNDALGYWEPCAQHIKPENHVLCVLTAQDFVDMVIASESSDEGSSNMNDNGLERHVQKIKGTHPGCKPIYLIEGLAIWMRKNHNARNRAYQAEVRRQFTNDNNNNDNNPNPPPTSNSRKNANTNKPETTPPVADDTIEDALLHLQVTHASLIHHTAAAPETAEWLKTFTEHVSTIPYRLEVMQGNDSAFCMDVGQVKTGEDRTDTFVKMLQEVNRVTASMAYGIVERYPGVGDLMEGLKRGGPGLLEDVKVCSRYLLFLTLFLPLFIWGGGVCTHGMWANCVEIGK